MMSNKNPCFAERLRQKQLMVGTIVTLPIPEISEILAKCGFDWLFIDAEHGAFDPHDAQGLLQAAGDIPCLIRVPAGDEVWIKKALDIGAAGLIVPQVNTAEQAQQVINFCKYSPDGNRGVGIARAHGYGLGIEDYISSANKETAIILQAEHRDAVDNIEEIVTVNGIDAILIGPYDLSASMGKIGNLNDPNVQDAIEKITRVCKTANISLGIFGVSAEAVKPYINNGFTLITVGIDSLFIINSAKETLQQLKN